MSSCACLRAASICEVPDEKSLRNRDMWTMGCRLVTTLKLEKGFTEEGKQCPALYMRFEPPV